MIKLNLKLVMPLCSKAAQVQGWYEPHYPVIMNLENWNFSDTDWETLDAHTGASLQAISSSSPAPLSLGCYQNRSIQSPTNSMNPYPTTPSHYTSSQIPGNISIPPQFYTRSPYSGPRPPAAAPYNILSFNHTPGILFSALTTTTSLPFQSQVEHGIRVKNASSYPQVPQEVVLQSTNEKTCAGQAAGGKPNSEATAAGKENRPAAISDAPAEPPKSTKKS